jgi:dipeptidase E
MKYYLSSFKLGKEPEKLKALLPPGRFKLAYIPNALDHATDAARLAQHIDDDLRSLRGLGLETETLDLKAFFGRQEELRERLQACAGVWISGGNTFVLRQAMRLSGLDQLLQQRRLGEAFVYAGYSAAGCVLGPTLKAYQTVDDPSLRPYPQQRETIWEGLGLVGFAFMPHFQSDHPESDAIAKEVEYCLAHGIPYRTVSDGEAIILNP